MRRVITYVDGFNLYHALHDLRRPTLKWLNLWSVSESLLRAGEQLLAVKYFSAYATWLPGPYSRHRKYVTALQHVGVEPIMGKFKAKPRRCGICGAKWVGHEEKETDVHIAVQLVADALTDRFDRAIIISADSDLAPAIRLVKQSTPIKEIFVAAPPGRFATARDLQPRLEITPGRVLKHLFPGKVLGKAGILVVERPTEYDP
jgi:hypothetical protein